MNKILKSVQYLVTRRLKKMADIKTYKKIEDLGWNAFEKTGNINDYGMVVSAREKIKQLEQEQDMVREM